MLHMSRQYEREHSPWRIVRNVFLFGFIIFMFLMFLIWRADNPRIEQFRLAIIDRLLPDMDVGFRPLSGFALLVRNIRGYEALVGENRQLRRELQQLERWRERALQLEQMNAELRALSNLSLTPEAPYITGEIIADSGGGFSQTALLNVGNNKRVSVGSAVVDGLGLVGRVIGVGEDKSRLLLLSDPTSKVSAVIMPDRVRALVHGANSSRLKLFTVDSGVKISIGSRVLTSGAGVFPADLLIGYVTADENNELGVQLAADYATLDLARILMPDATMNIPDFQHAISRNGSSEEPERADQDAQGDSPE